MTSTARRRAEPIPDISPALAHLRMLAGLNLTNLPREARIPTEIVCALANRSRGHLNTMVREGRFPKPVNAGKAEFPRWTLGTVLDYCEGKWEPSK
jgi:predicted DNA-binding transcriptional regulator AlpA